MRKYRFIGDIHGAYGRYLQMIQGCDKSVQVGDFGIGFNENPLDWIDPDYHKFIRGNHDNPALCYEQPNFIPDGKFEDGVFYMGGANSIDREWRTEGIDWWADEELSYAQLSYMIEKYAEDKPEVVVAHEVPSFLTAYFNRPIFNIESRTRDAFDQMYKIHQPKLWIAGHWHFPFDKIVDSTRFVILDCDSWIDIDLDNLLEGEQKRLIRF